MRIISAFSLSKVGRFAVLAVIAGIVLLLLSGAWNYAQEVRQARADRSNAVRCR